MKMKWTERMHGTDLQNVEILAGLHCKKEKEAKPVRISHKDPGVEPVGPESGSRIVCRFCRNYITAARAKIEMRGRHTHVFANPAGVVFEVGCFSIAPGCRNQGEMSAEFSWFSGYDWRFSLCSQCRAHLGWYFQSGTGNGFYGLILGHLDELFDEEGRKQ